MIINNNVSGNTREKENEFSKSLMNRIEIQTKLMKFLNKNFILIVKTLLWFHRIFGLTFGGLTISSNGRIDKNVFYKFYGISITFISIGFEMYLFMSIIFGTNIELKEEIFGNSKSFERLPIIISLLMYLTKSLALIAINFNGFGLINNFILNLKDYIKYKITLSLCLVFFIWFLHKFISFLFIFYAIYIINALKMSMDLEFILNMMEHIHCSIILLTLPIMMCLISLYCLQILNEMIEKLERIPANGIKLF